MKAFVIIPAFLLAQRLTLCESGIEWQVRGTGFDGDPRLADLRRTAGQTARDTLARHAEVLGFGPGKAAIVWVLDASVAREQTAGAEPFEMGRTAFEGASVVVTLPARKYLRAPGGAEQVIRHEAAHALLASALGSRERYEAVPRWLREGLALDASHEGRTALREMIAITVFQGRPADSFLVGILAPDVSHAEAYAALAALVSKLGADGVKALLERFVESRDLDAKRAVKLMEEHLGQSIEVFGADALRQARESVMKILPAGLERSFREALDSDARGEAGVATRKMAALLEADRDGPLASTLHYLLAKRGLEGARSGEAPGKSRAHLEALLAHEGSLWRPEALVLLGECLDAEGKALEAREAWLEVLEVFGEDAGPAGRARARLEKARVVK